MTVLSFLTAIIFLFSSQQSQKYGSRTNSGDVVVKFGPSSEAISTYRGRRTTVSISMDDKLKIKSQYNYMFQKLVDLSDGEISFFRVT